MQLAHRTGRTASHLLRSRHPAAPLHQTGSDETRTCKCTLADPGVDKEKYEGER